MGLTGLDIFKLLPKTNCKKCGQPTCLAFAMMLAQKKIELDKCPDITEEAKEKLAGAAAPPIRLVDIGADEKKLSIGQETQLFRHDEKFHHPCGVAVTLSDDLDEGALKERIDTIKNLKFTRVGTDIAVDMIAVMNKSGKADAFAKAAKAAGETGLLLLLSSENAAAMKAAVAEVGAQRPLLHVATAGNVDDMAKVAKDAKCPLAVKAGSLEEIAELAEKVKAAGVENIVIDLSADLKTALQSLTKTRRAALKKTFRALGHPPVTFVQDPDPFQQVLEAATFVLKYSGIVVVDVTEPYQIIPILTARMNIYTDPQKPIQVECKLYAVGDVNENSPVMFTTNFSLTYFSVESDVEASRVPTYILAVDTEGTSVLTAYSGDKLNEKVVHKAMQNVKLEEVVKHRKLIIPGHVAVMSGKLEEETGWEILVGPKESAVIPTYLKQIWT
ncbi:MAG: acetyl-CoA decarbonylase/synthase complex subunit gamma [Planctomycetes bacterium]|nr:acetyl-CoA decarbonylase/synthase complex subunit gamma [Planctomycetota bacterium]